MVPRLGPVAHHTLPIAMPRGLPASPNPTAGGRPARLFGMRHVLASLTVLAGAWQPFAFGGAATELGAPPPRSVSATATPTAPNHRETAGVDVCVVKDPRAVELSGLVAINGGYVAINDSQTDPARTRIFWLNQTCAITRTVSYPTAARDPEDVGVARDGTVWVADIGDNVTAPQRRRTIALWRVPASGGTPVIHRLAYPDGPHDAEALLLTADGQPIIITKEIDGRAGLYQPTGPLVASAAEGVPLRRVGEFAPISTGINNSLGDIGELLVTGAATTVDRSRVTLRTYTAAYEWDVPGGDLVKAITSGRPRVTVLPDERQGEAITYTVDGSAFVTVSDEAGPTALRRYPPSTVQALHPTATAAAAVNPEPRQTWLETGPARYGAIAAAVGGLGLVLAGLVGLRRNRRRS